MKSFLLSHDEEEKLTGILRSHSVTYYNSTKLFPQKIRPAVVALYAWVRKADEIVDNPTTDPMRALSRFEKTFVRAYESSKSDDEITAIFVRLAKAYRFEKQWPVAFLASMKLDLETTYYADEAELKCYTYGSAEIIGLMMARIMGVKPIHTHRAQALGHWMQMVNIVRDIWEDHIKRGRVYIPTLTLSGYGLTPTTVFLEENRPKMFTLVQDESRRLYEESKERLADLMIIPKESRRAVWLSVELYRWTMRELMRAPELILKRQLKPDKATVMYYFGLTTLRFLTWK